MSKDSSGGGGGGDTAAAAAEHEGDWREEFEDDADRHWIRFARAMESDPEQALRYSWSGCALWPQPQRPAPPACPACHAPRVFECQLLPPLLRLLNVDALSLALFCCSESCEPADAFAGVLLAQEVLLVIAAAAAAAAAAAPGL